MECLGNTCGPILPSYPRIHRTWQLLTCLDGTLVQTCLDGTTIIFFHARGFEQSKAMAIAHGDKHLQAPPEASWCESLFGTQSRTWNRSQLWKCILISSQLPCTHLHVLANQEITHIHWSKVISHPIRSIPQPCSDVYMGIVHGPT